MDEELRKLIVAAMARQHDMTQVQREAEFEAQRESFVRAEMPYGHDWPLEICEKELARLEQQIGETIGWGAKLGELDEDACDLRARIRYLRNVT